MGEKEIFAKTFAKTKNVCITSVVAPDNLWPNPDPTFHNIWIQAKIYFSKLFAGFLPT
jgi:hypothetical protein